MATLVQSLTGTNANVTNPSSTAFGAATTTGNTIVVGLMTDASGSANHQTSVTGGGVTTFTKRNSQGNGSDISMDIWSGTVTSGATTALTFGFSAADATRLVWLIEEWSGLGSYDVNSTLTTGTSTAPLSGSSGTLTNANSTVFGLVEWRVGASTQTLGSGFSDLITNGSATTSAVFGAMESKQVVATTAVTADFALGTSRKWGAIVAVFQNSGTATASPQPFQGLPANPVMQSFSW